MHREWIFLGKERPLIDVRKELQNLPDRPNVPDLQEAEGEVIGEARGRVQGELLTVIRLVRKKVTRNMSAKKIADMLEKDLNLIVLIYNALREHPDWNDEKISELL